MIDRQVTTTLTFLYIWFFFSKETLISSDRSEKKGFPSRDSLAEPSAGHSAQKWVASMTSGVAPHLQGWTSLKPIRRAWFPIVQWPVIVAMMALTVFLSFSKRIFVSLVFIEGHSSLETLQSVTLRQCAESKSTTLSLICFEKWLKGGGMFMVQDRFSSEPCLAKVSAISLL